MQERILNKATEMFFSYGIKSVTMDDIAGEMGVSKKTIYRFFEDKNSIVEQVIGNLIENHGEKVISCHQHAQNAIHEVVLQVESLSQLLQVIKPGILYDVQKYFPNVWAKINGHKYQCVLQGIVRNLERGVSEKIYRPYPDINTVSYIRLQQINSVFNQIDYPTRLEPGNLLGQISEMYLYGIASPEGQNLIPEYLNTKN